MIEFFFEKFKIIRNIVMKFKVKNNKKNNIAMLTRKTGYRYLRKDERTKETVFIKVLGAGGYPRFHLFLKSNLTDDDLIFDLHLDQKKPVYKEAHAHAAEYDTEIVKDESERIINILK